MTEPDCLEDPKFQKFREALDKLQAMWGDISLRTINTRREEARLAYADANGDYYPASKSTADRIINRSTREAKERFLYHHLCNLEQSLQPQSSQSSVIDAPSPQDIVKEVESFRDHVVETGLKPRRACFFYEHANAYAVRAMRRSDVPEEKIADYLGLFPDRVDRQKRATDPKAQP